MHLHKKLFLSTIIVCVLLSLSSVVSVEADSTVWTQTYGGTGDEWAKSIIKTSDGGYALAGYTDSFGAGEYDAWVVKTDEDGNAEWNKTYGGTTLDYASGLVETDDGGYAIAGYTQTSLGFGEADFWLIKVNATGDQEWKQTYDGQEQDFAMTLIATTDGGYAIAGYSDGDVWLVKTDANGNEEWNMTYGGTKTEDANGLVETSDGGYVLAGTTQSFGAGSQDAWLVKLNATGHVEWNQTYGGAEADGAKSVVETADGGYAIAGYISSFGAGMQDVWLIKTDEFGSMEWNMTYGGADADVTYSLFATGDGGYVIAGYTGTPMVDCDLLLIKTDDVGNMVWIHTYGGTANEQMGTVIPTANGGYVVAGATESFGAGGSDFWLIEKDSIEPYDFCFNVDESDYSVGVLSNSTVGSHNLDFELRQISFKVMGSTGTSGFCNVTIPKGFLWGDFAVYSNETALVEGADYMVASNGTHSVLSIVYSHSAHTLAIEGAYIVPEYNSWIAPTLLLATTLTIIVYAKKTHKQQA